MLMDYIDRLEIVHTGQMGDCDRKDCKSMQANYKRIVYVKGELPNTAGLCETHAMEDIAIARDSGLFKVVGLSDGVRFIKN